jgi:hypothetical protein
LPPAQAEKPPEVTPIQPTPPAQSGAAPRQGQAAGTRPAAPPRPAPPQAQRPKTDDAAARRRRALEALDQ